MLYDQFTEEEQDRITDWLIKHAEFYEGGWMVSGLVNLEWCNGDHYVVELENYIDGKHRHSAHLIPCKESP
jgi:hypothetical protein